MTPPLSESLLAANPAFSKVWKHLTTEVLRDDASQKTEGAARRRRQRHRDDPSSRWGTGVTNSRFDGGHEHEHERHDGDGGGSPMSDEHDEEEQEDEEDTTLSPTTTRTPGKMNVKSSNGETKRKKKTKFQDELYDHRVRWLKSHLLRCLLADVAYHANVTKEDDAPTKRRAVGVVEEEMDRTSHREPVSTTIDATTDTAVATAATNNTGARGAVGLRDLLLLISAYLDARLGREGEEQEEEEDLLADDIDLFKENLPAIADLLGLRIVELESLLGDMAAIATATATATDQGDQDANEYYGDQDQTTSQAPKSLLSQHIHHQLLHLSHLRTSLLPERLSTLTSQLHTLLALQRHLLRMQIQHVESSKHGILHRHAMSRLTFLTTVAEAMELKTRLLVLETQRDLDFDLDMDGDDNENEAEDGNMNANDHHHHHHHHHHHGNTDKDNTGVPTPAQRKKRIAQRLRELDVHSTEADKRLVALEELLDEYESVDPGLKLMQRLGTRYRDLEREMDGVRRHIETLEHKKSLG